jgi:hypothetical protein
MIIELSGDPNRIKSFLKLSKGFNISVKHHIDGEAETLLPSNDEPLEEITLEYANNDTTEEETEVKKPKIKKK